MNGLDQYLRNMQTGMQPSATGLSPQQQAGMVTGQPMQNPTGMSPEQMGAAVSPTGNLGPSNMSQIMSAIASIDPSVFDAPDAPQAQVMGGNTLAPAQMAPMQSMSSQVGALTDTIKGIRDQRQGGAQPGLMDFLRGSRA